MLEPQPRERINPQPLQHNRAVLGIFSGGGTKAIAFVGALREAEKFIRFEGWGGTSAGSIVAALLACGYTSQELQEVLYDAPFARIFKISPFRVALITHYRGVINPAPLLRWLRSTIAKKFPGEKRVNFADLPKDRLLKIVAANLSTQEIEIYSRSRTPGEEIAQAVLASCSYPLMFPPVKRGSDELVDGGVFSNFPLWLFDDEREKALDLGPVLGFAVTSNRCVSERSSFLDHVHSLFDSVLVAQDRVQEKYLDVPRSANVIRIRIPPMAALSPKVCCDRLLLSGREAASEYFKTATVHYGEPLSAPCAIAAEALQRHVAEGRHMHALSLISRRCIIHGGVARDEGLSAQRVLVRYYIDLMGAATEHDTLEALATILAEKIRSDGEFERIVGIKKGNLLLAYYVARLLQKPLSIFKTDMSYKMGTPFDGPVIAGERAVVVDDIASDSSMLSTAVRHLNLRGVHVKCVATLIERTEGDARGRLRVDNYCYLRAICSVSDEDIHNLVFCHVDFSRDGWGNGAANA